MLGLALAVGVPATWVLTRPPAAAGPSAEQVLAAPTAGRGTATPAPGTPPSVTTRDAAPPSSGTVPVPVLVSVPALGVSAPVDPVGVDPEGRMELPADVDRVGWYRFGPVPGGGGSAVLAGHVDDREQGLGVLAPLRRAAVGDEVLVTDSTGTAGRWRIVSRELIEKRALPQDALFRRDGPPRLVLVTCGGPFVPESGSYRDNVVVVAEPVR